MEKTKYEAMYVNVAAFFQTISFCRHKRNSAISAGRKTSSHLTGVFPIPLISLEWIALPVQAAVAIFKYLAEMLLWDKLFFSHGHFF